MAKSPIVVVWASTTSNKDILNPTTQGNGIVFNSDIVSDFINSALYINSQATRNLQVMGGYYDSGQDYKQYHFCSQILFEGGKYSLNYFMATQDTPTLAPTDATSYQQQTTDMEIPTNGSNVQSGWKKISIDTSLKKAQSNIENDKMYQLADINNNVFGEMRIKTYDTSGSLHCIFDVDLHKMGNEILFNIKNVLHGSTIRKATTTYSSFSNIFFMGFGLVLTTDGLYFGVKNNTLCESIEIEYSNMNFIPTLQEETLPTPNASSAKIYAIRNGGGSFIQDLGLIKNDYRANGNTPLGETLDFYLFSNGYVRWTSAMTLDSNYFHQWANGGFGSLNIDSSDKYLCNIGTHTGQVLGVIKSESLPEVKGEIFFTGTDGTTGGQFRSIRYGLSGTGCFSPKGSQGTRPTSNEDTALFKLSDSSSVYQDNAKVFGDCIPNYLVIQAF